MFENEFDIVEESMDTEDYISLKKLEDKARFIIAIKTTIGREKDVVVSLRHRVKSKNRASSEIFSLLAPGRLRGYVMVEFGLNYQQIEDMITDPHYREEVLEELNDHKLIGNENSVVGRIIKDKMDVLIKGLKYAKGVVRGITTIDEIEHFLSPPPLVRGIDVGDIVEIIKGPFKGEKAKISHKDESKEKVTVELLDAMVTIPLTIKAGHVRVIEKERE